MLIDFCRILQILAKYLAILLQKIEIAELCKGVRCVDLSESFQMNIYLQNLASIQPRTSPLKFVGSRDAAAPEVIKQAAIATAAADRSEEQAQVIRRLKDEVR